MSILSQYQSTLKHPEVEEVFDLMIFRPLAFPLVKLFVRLPITPNQISAAAMIAGLLGGILLATGTQAGFLWGAALYGLCNVLDCADGMVARLKGNGTRIGRVVDMFVDIFAHSSVFVGLGIGLTSANADLGYHPWTLVVAAGISYIAHCALVDYYRNEYMASALGKIVSLEAEIAEMSEELERYRSIRGAIVQRAFLRAYLLFTRLQLRGKQTEVRVADATDYAERNRLAVRLWTFIGPASHIVALMLAAFVDDIMIFFWFTIVIANAWSLLMWIYQQSINRQAESNWVDTTIL